MMKTYMAWIRLQDGTRKEWTGLRETQAKWRYHWAGRNWHEHRAKAWGWRAEAHEVKGEA